MLGVPGEIYVSPLGDSPHPAQLFSRQVYPDQLFDNKKKPPERAGGFFYEMVLITGW
jgi:hypothetical protein